MSRTTGLVTINPAPSPGVNVTAGFLYDVEVRFESDDAFDGIVQTFQVSGYANLTLVEIRSCD